MQSESLVNGVVAEVVVEVSVCDEEVYRLQVLIVDVGHKSFTLSLIVGSAVYDDALACFIADNVAVFLQHVACYCFDFHIVGV